MFAAHLLQALQSCLQGTARAPRLSRAGTGHRGVLGWNSETALHRQQLSVGFFFGGGPSSFEILQLKKLIHFK